ncbi:MAG: four helix bundle protein [Rikenellaceae bacterium]|nr:four helix bundle protein [Rikenellaceae bacterium]
MEPMLHSSTVAEKSKTFAIRIIRFAQTLRNEKREYTLSKQILRAGTSIGANIRESKNAQSDLDFISKLSIALKEADETAYWLELLMGSELIERPVFDELYQEVNELIFMLTAIIKTKKANVKKGA